MKSPYWALMALALMLTTGCTEEVADPAAGTETPATETTETAAPVTAAETASETTSIAAATPTPTTTAALADTAQGAAQAVIDGLAAGKADAVWAALPSSYQDDITELVQGFGNGMDPNVWQQIQGAIEKVHTVLDTKADFIANVPALQGMPDSDKFTTAIPQVAGLLQTIIGYSKLDGIKTFNGQEFFSGPASKLMSQVDALSKLSPEGVSVTQLKDMKVETVSSEGDTTTLKFTNAKEDSEPNEVEFVKVDGHWVPADMANDWDTSMASAREQLAALPEMLQQNGPMIGMFSGMITAGLDPLAAAEDQEQFNQAVEQLQAGMGGMLGPMLGGLSLGQQEEARFDDVASQLEGDTVQEDTATEDTATEDTATEDTATEDTATEDTATE
jgi:hypothetical protein